MEDLPGGGEGLVSGALEWSLQQTPMPTQISVVLISKCPKQFAGIEEHLP